MNYWSDENRDAFLDTQYDRGPFFLEWFFGQTLEMWESGCWEWQGALNPESGYGQVYVPFHLSWLRDRGRGTSSAHHVAWRLVTDGPIPNGLWILHRCDNPPCVRPSHLYVGTALQNARDRQERTYGRR